MLFSALLAAARIQIIRVIAAIIAVAKPARFEILIFAIDRIVQIEFCVAVAVARIVAQRLFLLVLLVFCVTFVL